MFAVLANEYANEAYKEEQAAKLEADQKAAQEKEKTPEPIGFVFEEAQADEAAAPSISVHEPTPEPVAKTPTPPPVEQAKSPTPPPVEKAKTPTPPPEKAKTPTPPPVEIAKTPTPPPQVVDNSA